VQDCPVTALLHRLGERWTPVLLHRLAERPHGFNELDRAVAGVSRRMLTRTLRGLEADGLVSRTVGPGRAPRVEYALTPRGRGVLDQLRRLNHWAVADAINPVTGSRG